MKTSTLGFVEHAKERVFNGKSYSLIIQTFDKRFATEKKKKLMKDGAQVRIYQGMQRYPAGNHEMKKAYYVYMR